MPQELLPWKVNVVRQVEDWLTIYAPTAADAEKQAFAQKEVVFVRHGHTVRGDRPVQPGSYTALEE